MSNETFQIEYDLTREDVHAWKAWWWANLVTAPWILTLLACILGTFVGLGVPAIFYVIVHAASLEWDPLLNVVFPVGLIAGIVFTVSAVRRKRSILLKRLQPQLGGLDADEWEQQFLGHRRLTATPEKIEVDGPAGVTSRKWRVVRSVHVTESHVVVAADIAIIVPRNAFLAEPECDKFVAAVESWIQQR